MFKPYLCFLYINIFSVACGEVSDPINPIIEKQYEDTFTMVCRGELELPNKKASFIYKLSKIVGSKYVSEAAVYENLNNNDLKIGMGVSNDDSLKISILGEEGYYVFTGNKDDINLKIVHDTSLDESKFYLCNKTFNSDVKK